jgi:hypothetical protein
VQKGQGYWQVAKATQIRMLHVPHQLDFSQHTLSTGGIVKHMIDFFDGHDFVGRMIVGSAEGIETPHRQQRKRTHFNIYEMTTSSKAKSLGIQ